MKLSEVMNLIVRQAIAFLDLNTVPQILATNFTSFEQVATSENTSHRSRGEIEAIDADTTDPDSMTDIEAHVPCFKNVMEWASIALANAWDLYGDFSQSSDDGTLYEDQMLRTKEEVVHAVKIFSIRSHQ